MQAQVQPAGVLTQNQKQHFENNFPRQKKYVQRKDSNIFGTDIQQNDKTTNTTSGCANDEENIVTKNGEVLTGSSSKSENDNHTQDLNNSDNFGKNGIFFENRWKTVEKAPVRLCIVRKPGYPRLSALENDCGKMLNFRREKSVLTPFKNEDNLCNDRFLTGKQTAQMLDVVKTPRNRSPLTDTLYGPFCNTTIDIHAGRIDHLDRTCVPKELNTKDTKGFSLKKRFTQLINKNRIYATEGFLIGDDSTLSKSNVFCHRYEPVRDQGAPQNYHGRARIIAPWTQSTNVLQ